MNSGNHHPNGKIAERQAAVDDAMVRSFDAELLSNRADKVLQVENGAEALRLTDGSGSWKLFGGMRFSVPCAVALYFQLVGLSSLAPAEEAPAATTNRTQFATSQAVDRACPKKVVFQKAVWGVYKFFPSKV